MPGTVIADSSQLAKAMAKIASEVRDGLDHGHFEIAITCTVANTGIRDLVVKAGKSYRYRITKEELEA